FAEEIELIRRLHTLSNHGQAQRLPKFHQRLDEFSAVVRGGNGLDEAAIDLERIDRESVESVERGEAGAKVIDVKTQARLMHLPHDAQRDLGPPHQHRLRDLKGETVRLNPMTLQGGKHGAQEVLAPELLVREDRKSTRL